MDGVTTLTDLHNKNRDSCGEKMKWFINRVHNPKSPHTRVDGASECCGLLTHIQHSPCPPHHPPVVPLPLSVVPLHPPLLLRCSDAQGLVQGLVQGLLQGCAVLYILGHSLCTICWAPAPLSCTPCASHVWARRLLPWQLRRDGQQVRWEAALSMSASITCASLLVDKKKTKYQGSRILLLLVMMD